MVLGAYVGIKEHQIKINVVKELKLIEKKLNVEFFDIEYVINELDISDILTKKDFNKFKIK